MRATQKWAQLVAAALRETVRWVYEGLQGPSDGLTEDGRGSATRRRPQRLRGALCNTDTQRPWTEPK